MKVKLFTNQSKSPIDNNYHRGSSQADTMLEWECHNANKKIVFPWHSYNNLADKAYLKTR